MFDLLCVEITAERRRGAHPGDLNFSWTTVSLGSIIAGALRSGLLTTFGFRSGKTIVGLSKLFCNQPINKLLRIKMLLQLEFVFTPVENDLDYAGP